MKRTLMAIDSGRWVFLLYVLITLLSLSSIAAAATSQSQGRSSGLSSFEEHRGDNLTFHCTASGPCVACGYSEKSDQKYRCSETGYRVPFKCVKIERSAEKTTGEKLSEGRLSLEDDPNLHGEKYKAESDNKDSDKALMNHDERILEDTPSESQISKQHYVVYRSCVPEKAEEKLSVLGFEVIMICFLFISTPVIYFRRKHAASPTSPGIGMVRLPTSSRY